MPSALTSGTHWQATSALRVNFIAAYIDSTYKDYTAPDGVLQRPRPPVCRWSLAGGIDYVFRDVIGGDVDFTLQDAYIGPRRCNADSRANGACLQIPAFPHRRAENRAPTCAWPGSATHACRSPSPSTPITSSTSST